MLVLNAKEFQNQDIVNITTTEVVFQGTWLTKTLSFAKHLRDKALVTCRTHLEAGQLCILVESKTEIAIWLQKPEYAPDNLLNTLSTPLLKPKADLDRQTTQSKPLEKTTLGELEPEFIELCRQQLLEYIIEPIAERLLSKTLKNHPQATAQQLIELLASQISNASQAEKFRQSLSSYGS